MKMWLKVIGAGVLDWCNEHGLAIFLSFVAGALCATFAEREEHNARLAQVGIKEVKHCVVETVEESTNYYQIVWFMDQRKKAR